MSHSTTSSRKAGAEFLSKNRYKSTIPPLPFDPKSLKYPFPEDLLYKFTMSSLEKHTSYILPVPEIHMDLIQMAVFESENRREPKVLALTDTSRAGQIKVIESTFTACASRANAHLKHPQDPTLTPKFILPILPDLKLSSSIYAHISCEEALSNEPPPLLGSLSSSRVEKKTGFSTAVLRPRVSNESGTLFYLYTPDPHKPETHFKYVRAYTFEANPGDPLHKFFFSRHGNDVMYYTPIQSKLTFSKYREVTHQTDPAPMSVILEPRIPSAEVQEKRLESVMALGISKPQAHRYLNQEKVKWHEP
ncbi:hypothetical protein HMI55_001784 [Coelomomyces lativittatus]|nr:hypothetical protein HMI55_001784 [Coelomomyces lativittatus]